MDDHDDRSGKRADRTHSAAAASGASQKRDQTLLPMLVGGLLLIVIGMLAVVFWIPD